MVLLETVQYGGADFLKSDAQFDLTDPGNRCVTNKIGRHNSDESEGVSGVRT